MLNATGRHRRWRNSYPLGQPKGGGIRVSLAGKVLLVALAGLAGIMGLTAGASAQDARTTAIELRVWQHREDASIIHITARPAGGSWGTLGTIPLPLDDGISQSGRWRFGDVAISVPLEAPFLTRVDVRVWQRVANDALIHISARPARGDWNALPTQRLPLDGISRSGSYRYGDATLAVPLPYRFDVPVPTAAIEFEGDFTAAERAALEEQLEQEFERVATFFARTYGEAASGLTLLMERPGEGVSYGRDVIRLSEGAGASGVAIAHEYVHALQADLSPGGEPTWISEGVATYLQMRYDDAVGNQTFEEWRDYWRRSARHAEGPIEGSWGTGDGGAAPWYGVSMLAAEQLVELVDEDALFEFYRQLDGESSWQSTFADVFGVTTDDFYASFDAYRLEVAPRVLFFRGVVLGPDGAPVEGLRVSAKRPGDTITVGGNSFFISLSDVTNEDGTFDVPAESFPRLMSIYDDDGNLFEPYDEEPVVLELRATHCGDAWGYLGPDGNRVERMEDARVFLVEGLTITGIVINLSVDPWSLDHVTDCGEWGVET